MHTSLSDMILFSIFKSRFSAYRSSMGRVQLFILRIPRITGLWIPWLILSCLALSSLANILYSNAHALGSSENQLLEKAIEQIQSDYVEPVPDKKLVEDAIQGMLTARDPHSNYLDQKSFNSMKSSAQGEFGGIGVEMTYDKGLAKVISPYDDGPAFKAGVRVGDIIVSVDGQDVTGTSLPEIADKLRGDPGGKVKVRVYREGGDRAEFEITREIIKIIPVKSKLLDNNRVAYIKINNFNSKTAGAVKDAYFDLSHSKEIEGLILDLRWNPGGLLEQAVSVADLFLTDADIVSIKGRNPQLNHLYRASNHDITQGMPIVVIINGGSASAAEIVAGALQDNRRALLVGTKSFGKGSVQTVFPLSNGGAMKMTTALYYTPSGRMIQASGILPNIIVPEAAVVREIDMVNQGRQGEASLRGHIKGGNEVSPNESTGSPIDSDDNGGAGGGSLGSGSIKGTNEYIRNLTGDDKRDFQLLRAIDTLKTMIMYSNSQSRN